MSSNSKKLVIVNQDVGYLFVDLANAALSHYDEVVLVSGSIIELGSRLDERVTVRQMFRYRRQSVLSRFTSWILGFFHIVWLLLTRFRTHEVLAASNPPLTTLLPLFVRNKIGLYVLDLYPEALHKTGMVSARNPVVRIWAILNSVAYRRFDAIWALTPSMKAIIEEQYEITVDFAPAWAGEFATGEDHSFLDRQGLTGRWIVLYSGNLGREHEIEALLDCAAILTDRQDLIFVIAGDGWKKKALEERVASEGLSNVVLLPKLPGAEFSALLAHARVGVVTQSLRTADVCIPSKTFNLLASGLPVLGIGKPDSDFGELINGDGAGRVFMTDQVDGMSKFLSNLREDDAVYGECQQQALHSAKTFTRSNARRVLDQFATDISHG